MRNNLLLKRLEAGLLDIIAVFFLSFIPAIFFAHPGNDDPPYLNAVALACYFLFPVSVISLWGARNSQTPGMWLLGIDFRSREGDRITYWRGACRVFVGALMLPLIPISLLVATLDVRGRMISDLLLGTVVLKCGSENTVA